MWVRLTSVKVQPEKVDELRRIYYGDIVPAVRAQKGSVDVYLLEPTEEGAEFISLNAWDTKENGDEYEASGSYAELVNTVKHTFAGPPTLKSYEVKR